MQYILNHQKTFTENGAKALSSSGYSALVDLFGLAGSLRSRDRNDVQQKFAAAFREDALLATKMLFYIGDIRYGGLGERKTFKACLNWLAINHPEIVNKNMALIPYFNRFDSWFELVGTKCEDKMWDNLTGVFVNDINAMKAGVPISLLAKWMPSENASSIVTKSLAKIAMKKLGFKPREYRKLLTKMRSYIGIVEQKMSSNDWKSIDYSKVPSYAMHNYMSAFAKHDYEGFNNYLNKVKKGEAKINSSVLFPSDLVSKYLGHYGWNYHNLNSYNEAVEAQWNALPNYLSNPINALIMADISDSMFGNGKSPIHSSVGLAIYFAQHNHGIFHNKYMTFNNDPKFIELNEGASLYENVSKVANSGMGFNTNLYKAFVKILDMAIEYNIPNEDMPKALIVISDMEIDSYSTNGKDWSFINLVKQMYNANGYDLPKCIMWNVQSRHDVFLAHSTEAIFVSGQSASIFKSICDNIDSKNAIDFMIRTLNKKVYSIVTI